MRREFPRTPIFTSPLFATAEYTSFEQTLLAAVDSAIDEDPHTIAVERAVPAIADRLRTMTGAVNALKAQQAVNRLQLEQKLDGIENMVRGLYSGHLNI